jgi:hypothetical protein
MIREEEYWSAYAFAVKEAWGDEWLVDHADCELPAKLRDEVPAARQRITARQKLEAHVMEHGWPEDCDPELLKLKGSL